MANEIKVRLSIRRVYQLLMDYFTSQADIEVKGSVEPSEIEVKIGSWTSLRGNPPGTVKLKMHPESKKTCIDFTFDFAAWFATWFVIAVIVNIVCFAIRFELGAFEIFVTVLTFVWIMPEDVRTQKKKIIGRIRDFLKMQTSDKTH